MKNLTVYGVELQLAVAVLTLLIVGRLAYAQPVINLTSRFSGLDDPVQIVNAGDGSNRVFVVEQSGGIKVFPSDFSSSSTFFTVPGVLTGGEQGLLSLVFDPDYSTNGHFYVFFVSSVNDGGVSVGDLRVVRYTNSAPASNTTSGGTPLPILAIPHPTHTNHNGGEMHFGADGNLYLSVGDGAVAANSQNLSNLLGKLLRINVKDATPETPYTVPVDNPFGNVVYALGLRNPFRWSFDRETGDMWIGDVGQGSWEEINFIPAGNTLGANFGWPCYEGNQTYDMAACGEEDYTFPVHVYPTDVSKAVIGGVVYRGANPTMADFRGYYVAGDYVSGHLRIIEPAGLGGRMFTQTSGLPNVTDVGETEDGELLMVSISGGIYSVTADVNPLPVTLIGFSGVNTDEGAHLTWETASEHNFLQFDIELSSDGKRFITVGSVPSGAAYGAKYQFLHQRFTAGLAYYRLKMVDRDGSFAHSRMISINFTESPVAGFVRPSFIKDGQINLFLEGGYNRVQVVSVSGNTVLEKDISNRTGVVDIPITSVSSGVYIVRLEGSNKVDQQKIVVIE
jgi:glucose/arabinose dehydrogenase